MAEIPVTARTGHEPPNTYDYSYVVQPHAYDTSAFNSHEVAALSNLVHCPHCGHGPHLWHERGQRWGSYDWVLRCSSGHCGARVVIVADGYREGTDESRTRITSLCRMWNRRFKS